jgi:hypothetical protein
LPKTTTLQCGEDEMILVLSSAGMFSKASAGDLDILEKKYPEVT